MLLVSLATASAHVTTQVDQVDSNVVAPAPQFMLGRTSDRDESYKVHFDQVDALPELNEDSRDICSSSFRRNSWTSVSKCRSPV